VEKEKKRGKGGNRGEKEGKKRKQEEGKERGGGKGFRGVEERGN